MDRREKLALDDAYRFFRAVMKEDGAPDLYKLANCLKTVSNALRSSANGEFKLTIRLWQRIQVLLFDKLICSFPAHVVILSTNGGSIPVKEDIADEAIVEIHPEGLKRADDAFRIGFKHLHPITQLRLKRVWQEKGPATKPEDFTGTECGDSCTPHSFIIGDEVLQEESKFGKQLAYQKWWELYWQAYCSIDRGERALIENEMGALEKVWGNLYY
jgi:hypothetical protein